MPRGRGMGREGHGDRERDKGTAGESPGHGPNEKEPGHNCDRVLGRGDGGTRGKKHIDDLEKDRITDRPDRQVRPEALADLIGDHNIAGAIQAYDDVSIIQEEWEPGGGEM